ncbi:MAG: M48 family metallopeptidase [Clostridium sp.]|nr:M48 family metallopeptidase [Clostridium sp.]
MKSHKLLKFVIFIFILSGIISINNKQCLSYEKLNTISVEQNAKSREEIGQKFYESDRVVKGLKVIVSIGIPIVFLATGFSAKLRNASQSIGKTYFITIGIYGVLYNLINDLISFPLSYYGGYVQRHYFGLSHQPFLLWLKNYLINLGISSIVIFLILWIPYRIIKASPKRWWIYTGIISIPLTFIMFLAQPIVIDPLFNDFKPIKDKQMEQSLINLTKQANIENCNILKVDKSKETDMMNAYMTGIGKSKRIVLWDTTVDKLNLREIKFVTAHEIGHYVLGHIKKMMILQIISIFVIFYIIYAIAPYIIDKYKYKFKFNSLQDIASLPLIILMLNLCILAITPSSNTYSCYMEKQADTFAIEITRDNEAAISSFQKLSESGIVIPNPDPIYKLWTYDHPPISERVEFFKKYKPWTEGKQLIYEEYINTKSFK